MTAQWLCIGGPLAGQYRPSEGGHLIEPAPLTRIDYGHGIHGAERSMRVAVAVPRPPIVYHPVNLQLQGWRVHLAAWMADDIVRTGIPNGTVLPGGIQGAPIICEAGCRLCYGRAMNPEVGVCSRISCITAVSAIESLDHLTADDAKGWADDA
jgi:hypothetical protein